VAAAENKESDHRTFAPALLSGYVCARHVRVGWAGHG